MKYFALAILAATAFAGEECVADLTAGCAAEAAKDGHGTIITADDCTTENIQATCDGFDILVARQDSTEEPLTEAEIKQVNDTFALINAVADANEDIELGDWADVWTTTGDEGEAGEGEGGDDAAEGEGEEGEEGDAGIKLVSSAAAIALGAMMLQ